MQGGKPGHRRDDSEGGVASGTHATQTLLDENTVVRPYRVRV
jgi:hypothetical protein